MFTGCDARRRDGGGHEYGCYVEEVGRGVTSLQCGQFVIGSFFASDNTCPHCQHGYQTSCEHKTAVGGAGNLDSATVRLMPQG